MCPDLHCSHSPHTRLPQVLARDKSALCLWTAPKPAILATAQNLGYLCSEMDLDIFIDFVLFFFLLKYTDSKYCLVTFCCHSPDQGMEYCKHLPSLLPTQSSLLKEVTCWPVFEFPINKNCSMCPFMPSLPSLI